MTIPDVTQVPLAQLLQRHGAMADEVRRLLATRDIQRVVVDNVCAFSNFVNTGDDGLRDEVVVE